MRVDGRQVIVVGGGPHGLLLALALGRVELDVTLLEARPPTPISSPRAMMFHWSMMAGLADLGVLDEAIERGITHRIWSLNVLQTGERMYFDLDVLADDVPYPFTLHLPQQRLCQIVLERLGALSNVEIAWHTRAVDLAQDGDGVTVTADSPDGRREYRAAYAVGADGATSMVRRAIGLGLPGFTWPERFVAVNARYDFGAIGYEASAVQLDPNDGALLAKIDDTGLWRYTYAESLALPEDSVGERMPDVFARVLPGGVVPEVEAFASHRMHQRVADTFRLGRVLLIADAAHITSPASGYGLAGGFFDGLTLVEALTAVLQGGADEEVLDQYSQVRRRVFTEVISPVSSDSKQLLWDSRGAGRLEGELERFRRITSDPSRARQYLLLGLGLASAPLRVRRATGL
jgi:3-(3-hydroxy-phenyl)propionate hydroxylase